MNVEEQALAEEKKALVAAEKAGGVAALTLYVKKSGPGWLQSAITLGGGSLSGSLYLGILAGFSLMWLQPVAMIMGVMMLSSISYVTLSTGKRPFHAINDHINPVLGWGWAIATLMANIVWCLPQFSLGTAAVTQNLIPALNNTGGKVLVCVLLLATASTVIYFYESGAKGVRVFEWILKGMVAVVVLSFFGVVFKMSVTGDGLPWMNILAGFSPDLSMFSRPSHEFAEVLARTDTFGDYWSGKIVTMQRDVMITAVATAVGINMTFLLPYSMLKKGWGKEHRGLAIFDLSTGLFVPFLLATSCVVIAAASQFHAKPDSSLIMGTNESKGLLGQYEGILKARLKAEIGADSYTQLSQDETSMTSRLSELPMADKQMASMLVKRDAFHLAQSLETLTGKTFSHVVFGIGVLGMALSTIIILMLISGFTVCEIAGLPHKGMAHFGGCMLAGLGVLGPFVWSGKTQFWLAVPTSVFGMTLLPIAYFTFFLMINNKGLMGSNLPKGKLRIVINLLLLVALSLATFGAGWSIWSKIQWVGVALVGVFIGAAVIVHFVRPPLKVEPDSKTN